MALEDAHIVYEEEEGDDDQTTATTRLPPQATCGLSCNMSRAPSSLYTPEPYAYHQVL